MQHVVMFVNCSFTSFLVVLQLFFGVGMLKRVLAPTGSFDTSWAAVVFFVIGHSFETYSQKKSNAQALNLRKKSFIPSAARNRRSAAATAALQRRVSPTTESASAARMTLLFGRRSDAELIVSVLCWLLKF